MESESGYPQWVRAILEKITVTIYRGKTGQVLKENEPILRLKKRLLSPGRSEYDQKAFVIGFEDEEDVWNECSDVVVKTYDLKEPSKYRVEIFCSGVNRKIIKFEGKEVLDYPGYSEEDIKDIIKCDKIEGIRGTVIFDTQTP